MSLQVVMVCNPANVETNFPDMVREKGVDFSVKDCRTDDEKIEACRDADFIITILGQYPFNRHVIENLDKCRFIEGFGVGYTNADLEAATEHGIGVIHNPGFCSEELSDHAMALMLACSRWIVGLHTLVKRRTPPAPASPEVMAHMSILKGRTLGLIGFGNSGRAMVPKARGFGMRILAYDPYVDKAAVEELKVEKVSLERLIAESDYISIHAMLTSENKHLLGLEEFKKMKPNAFIINTSRGAIINESELYTALTERYIAGAGLDVTEGEPVTKTDPLTKLDNVILTGHNAGGSWDSYATMWRFPVEQIDRVIRGEWPLGLVNPEVKPKYVEKWGRMTEPGD